MEKVKNHFYKVFMQVSIMLLLSAVAFSQTNVTGKVTDSKDGSPIQE
ncbi:MAG: hypothetical protein IPP48_15975 [Chitinophagaceae bacterium]|nr:hypothetical protein [Chitinophagaceae bacterium]